MTQFLLLVLNIKQNKLERHCKCKCNVKFKLIVSHWWQNLRPVSSRITSVTYKVAPKKSWQSHKLWEKILGLAWKKQLQSPWLIHLSSLKSQLRFSASRDLTSSWCLYTDQVFSLTNTAYGRSGHQWQTEQAEGIRPSKSDYLAKGGAQYNFVCHFARFAKQSL